MSRAIFVGGKAQGVLANGDLIPACRLGVNGFIAYDNRTLRVKTRSGARFTFCDYFSLKKPHVYKSPPLWYAQLVYRGSFAAAYVLLGVT
jgi:hypothetical protein